MIIYRYLYLMCKIVEGANALTAKALPEVKENFLLNYKGCKQNAMDDTI